MNMRSKAAQLIANDRTWRALECIRTIGRPAIDLLEEMGTDRRDGRALKSIKDMHACGLVYVAVRQGVHYYRLTPDGVSLVKAAAAFDKIVDRRKKWKSDN